MDTTPHGNSVWYRTCLVSGVICYRTSGPERVTYIAANRLTCYAKTDFGETSAVSVPTPTINPATPELEFFLPVISAERTPARTGTATIAVEPPTVVEPKRSAVVSWTVRMAGLAEKLVTRVFPVAGAAHGRAGRFVERTLDGLEQCFCFLPAHRGGILAERARLQIERVLEVRWKRYQHFLCLCAAMEQSRGTFSPADCYLHLNPASQWVRVREQSIRKKRAIRKKRDELSSDVLFFRLGPDIRGARMNLECQVLMNELADYQPCTVAQWARCSSLGNTQQLMLLAEHLRKMGLVAWNNQSSSRDSRLPE